MRNKFAPKRGDYMRTTSGDFNGRELAHQPALKTSPEFEATQNFEKKVYELGST